jgi:hypothetical protein
MTSGAPLIDERCNYNAMIEFVTIRKLRGLSIKKVIISDDFWSSPY